MSLKPTTDVGSQVIVNGHAIGNMSAKEYFAHKKELIPDIMDAYNSLCGVPVVGVVPYLHVDIDDEDSLSTR
ncbi:MAG: hypothetical protein J5928_01470 [Firmicutes bacterium]|nr:hypothetical protein [Bacillota bacterium]